MSQLRRRDLVSDTANQLIDAAIDSVVCSSVDFNRLFDRVLDASMNDGFRVEIPKEKDLPSTDRKPMSYGASLVLVHYDDHLGLAH